MKKYDVIILTDDRYVGDEKKDQLAQNVYVEDGLLQEALLKLGLKAERKSWSDPLFDWSSTRYIVFRSTWDYVYRFEEFFNWIEKVSKLTTLLNSESLIRWNINKHYMLDLQKKGVHICETYFIEAGTQTSLQELHQLHKLNDVVLKPCVSGGARHTYKIKADELEQYESIFQELISKEAMMLQPFQQNIVTKGEVSMMVINGKFTHAVLKIAQKGDFRVQDDFGGTVQQYHPTVEEINYAEKVVKSCSEMPIYARVDVFLDNQNQMALAELELIEPEMWFRDHPEAAQLLALGIKERIE
ncbi:ATP-grasp domain-containing protein [Pseudotenacibaculum haliotis]|uniref:RimK family alpha-L-glutamate ligase n=1 Tax=Pseudotenacibaculum haliotis TaxID=1862138 RepID=A0ABW5LUP0_9FLAO